MYIPYYGVYKVLIRAQDSRGRIKELEVLYVVVDWDFILDGTPLLLGMYTLVKHRIYMVTYN